MVFEQHETDMLQLGRGIGAAEGISAAFHAA